MLPPISAVLSVEMIRDGGSLSASFLGTNGSKYCLHFQVRQERSDSGEWVRLRYEKPVVFERLEYRTIDRFEWRSANEVEISWDHARTLLNEVRGFVQAERDLQWLDAMKDVTDLAGELPPSISRVVGGKTRDA